MPIGIDKWLKGLDDVAGLDRGEIDTRLEDLETLARSTQLKIAVLKELRQRAPASPQEQQSPPAEPDAAEAPNGARPHDWKRRAVLDLIRAHPNKQTWGASAVRDALIAQGIMATDEGTPTRLLMRRLGDAGLLRKVGPAAYEATDKLWAKPGE